MSTKPKVKTDNYQAAQAKANKAEAKRMAGLLKTMERNLDKLNRQHQRELRKITAEYVRREREYKRDFAKAQRATDRAKKQIYRRLQILNGRAN